MVIEELDYGRAAIEIPFTAFFDIGQVQSILDGSLI